MQKKLIALAVASIASSAALAQSNVELYGVVDLSVMSSTGSYSGQVAGTTSVATPAGVYTGIGKSAHSATGAGIIEYGSRAELANGNRDTSRLGFRGTENLGSGLKASFVIESSIAADGGTANGANTAPTANILGDREATLAVSGKYGQVKAGRQQLAFIDQVEDLDVFGGNGPGNVENMLINPLTSTRVNNSLRYDVSVMGVKLNAQYSMSENSDRLANANVGSITNIGATYAMGPLTLSAAHLIARDATNNAVTGAANTLSTQGVAGTTGLTQANVAAIFASQYAARSLTLGHLGASYDFGVAKLSGQYITTSSTKTASDEATVNNLAITAIARANNILSTVGGGEALINSTTYALGLTVPMGAHKFLGSFVSTNDKRTFNRDARSAALGYEYALSKRTTLYARGAKVYNTNGSVFGTTGGGTAVALAQAGDANNRTTSYLAGVSHSF